MLSSLSEFTFPLSLQIMRQNINSLDKIIRIALSLAMLSIMLLVSDDFFLEMICGMFGIYFIITAFKGICPLYAFLQINTKNNKKGNQY